MTRIFQAEEARGDGDTILQFKQYLRLLVERWRVIAAICAVTTAAGLIHYLITPPSYRASTTIQIEQASLLDIGGERNPWLDAWASVKYYPTQYRILRSRDVAERTVKALALTSEPGSGAESTEETGAQRASQLANQLQAAAVVDPIEGTELVRLHYVSDDPELAARVVNGLAQAFIDRGIESRSTLASRTSELLENEILDLRQKIQSLEGEISEYSRSTNLVNLESSSNPNLQRLQQLYDDLSDSVSERINKEIRLRELRGGDRDNVANIESAGLIAQLKRDLLGRERDYETKRQIYKDDWPEMQDLKAEIDERRRVLAAEVDRYFEAALRREGTEYQAALQKEQSLDREIDKATTAAQDLNEVTVRYEHIQAEIEAYREREDELIRRLSEVGTSARLSGERESNVRVVDRALIPTAPFRPSLRQDLLLALSAGLALGIGIILLTYFLDRTVKSSEELERLLGLPVLAVIPDVSRPTRGYGYRSRSSRGPGQKRRRRKDGNGESEDLEIELLPITRPRLAVSEAYRSLRTALLLASAEEIRTLTVTSPEAGEGKTATSVNLAIVMAQLGRRVLLIDGDLRRSRLHKIFQLSNRQGLVNYLTGSVRPEDIICGTSVPDLSVIPAGPHPPNPSELLASERMHELLRVASLQFDTIIIDTPPVLAVTDAILIGAASNGTVVCFRANRAVRENIRTCRDRLERADVKILGAVLNGYYPRPGASYSRGYQYYEAYAEGHDGSAYDAA